MLDIMKLADPQAAGGSGDLGATGGRTSRLDPVWDRLTPTGAKKRIAKRGHCSALIKVTPDLAVSALSLTLQE